MIKQSSTLTSKINAQCLQAARARIHPCWGVRSRAIPMGLGQEFALQPDFENDGGSFVLNAAGTRPESIPDDQTLFFDTQAGVVVSLGCPPFRTPPQFVPWEPASGFNDEGPT